MHAITVIDGDFKMTCVLWPEATFAKHGEKQLLVEHKAVPPAEFFCVASTSMY